MAAEVKVEKSGTEEDEVNPFTREERDRIIAAFKANRYYSCYAPLVELLPDIEYRNPYQTRHTFCSLCREADIASIQIAKWVGNSAQIIDRVYARPIDHIQVPNL